MPFAPSPVTLSPALLSDPTPRPGPILEGLLRELGPRLRRGGPPDAAALPERCATGVAAVDRLLGGGFPRARLCEVSGPASAGRTSLALAALARATAAGEFAALVDAADAFDPTGAAAAGVDLERVLWVRAPRGHEVARSAERLLATRGFTLVLLDLAGAEPAGAVSSHAWLRLRRAAVAARAALVVLGEAQRLGSSADLALELAPGRPRFVGTPPLLEGLDAEIRLTRSRFGAHASRAAVRWDAA